MYNMEINFSNLDTRNPYDTFDYNSYEIQNNNNYWEQNLKKETVESKPKKKKVSFDDILSNMNLVVNNQGILQYMMPIQQDNQYTQDYNQTQYQYNPNEFNRKIEPIDPSVKHSYIYNKYFKDYNDQTGQKSGPRVPKTIEEYKQMLLDDKIKTIKHKMMVEQVKSKKMFFTSVPGATSNPRNIQATKNNLRSMNFK